MTIRTGQDRRSTYSEPPRVSRTPLLRGVLWRLRSAILSLTLLPVLAMPASAQSGALRIVVDGETYAVRGVAVTRASGDEVSDPTIVENARFTARVLDQHILRSEQNKVRYSAPSRAMVFADATPQRSPRRGCGTPRTLAMIRVREAKLQGMGVETRQQPERTRSRCCPHRLPDGCTGVPGKCRHLSQGHSQERAPDPRRRAKFFQ